MKVDAVDLLDDDIQDDGADVVPPTPVQNETFALSEQEVEMVKVIRDKKITMQTLGSLALFRTQLIARAKRNDVVVGGKLEDSKYEAMTDQDLLARIEDRNAIIKAKKLAPPTAPEVSDEVEGTMKPAGAPLKPGDESTPGFVLTEAQSIKMSRMKPEQVQAYLDNLMKGNK